MKAFIKQILFATCLTGVPTCAYALPFNQNPQSFQNFMNSQNWDDGSKAIFHNIGRCYFNPERKLGYAVCHTGFVTISNPMGTKICETTKVSYEKFFYIDGNAVKTDQTGTNTHYDTGNCRYK